MSDVSKGPRRVADILQFVARTRVAPSSSQIFGHLELPRSSGYDLLRGLAEHQFLKRQPAGHWVLGDEFYALALSRFGLGKIASRIDPILRALQEETQETAQLAVLHHSSTLITHAFSSTRSIHFIAEVGTELPVNWTAAGRPLLSNLSAREQRESFASHSRPSPTGNAVTMFAAFSREVKDAQHRGYAFELEQAQARVCTVAAPVLASNDQCIAAVMLVLPVERFLNSRDTIVSLVCSAAQKLRPQHKTAEAFRR